MNLIVVLGMHRCGTSVLAKCLNVLGVDLGDNLLEPNLSNPRGYFEDKSIVELNESILGVLGSRWDSLQWKSELPASQKSHYQRLIRGFLEGHHASANLFGIKDPRITRLLPIWIEVFDELNLDVGYVMANRHPLEVADSLKLRDEIPLAQGVVLWILHQIEALEVVIREGGLVVSYQQVLEKPLDELRRLGRHLGVDVDPKGIEIQKFESHFLDAGLRHSKFDTEHLSQSGVPASLCEHLFVFLEELAGMPEAARGDEVEKGLSVIARLRDSLTESDQWMKAIDDLNILRVTENSRSGERERVLATNLARLESQLRWIESRPSYRVFQALTSFLRRFRIAN